MEITLILVAIALTPATVTWWTGRRLIRLRDDPALPELLFNQQRVILSVTWVAMTVLVLVSHLSGILGQVLIFLPIASAYIGSYKLRRAIHGDTIGFPAFVREGLKSIVGSAGFLLVLLLTPSVIASLGEAQRPFGLVLLPILFAWEHWYPQIWLRLHNAVAFNNAEVNSHIDRILERSGMGAAAPDVYIVGAPGQRFVNALALRGKRAAIAFGNVVPELLTTEEVGAVYAHELGHIEQIAPRELRRMQAINRLLIALAVAVPFLLLPFVPLAAFGIVSLLWMVVVLLTFVHRLQKSQAHETDADRRAAALTGDPEVVARALMKLHVHGLIPRRWSIDFERTATHPSLARRMQALRGASGEAAPPLGEPVVIPTARPGSVVVFDEQRAYWFDGVPDEAARELASLRDLAAGMRFAKWQDLVELRVTADGEDDRLLVATHRNGDTWSVPIERGSVAAVQSVLDRVDLRLSTGLTAAKPMSPRLILGTLVAGAFLLAPSVLLVPMLLALWSPGASALAAVGGIGIVQAVIGGLSGRGIGFAGLAVIMLVFAVISLRAAWTRKNSSERQDAFVPAASILGLLAVAMAGAIVAGLMRAPLIDVLSWRLVSSFTATLAGLGALLFIVGRPKWRWAALGLAAGSATGAAIAIGALGHSDFAETVVTPREILRVDLRNVLLHDIRLSPSGTHFLGEGYAASPAGRKGFILGLATGKRRDIDALDAEFISDDRLVTLRTAGDSFEVRLERTDTNVVEWTVPLPPFDDPVLSASPGDGTWNVHGSGEDGSWIVVAGSRDSADARVTRLRNVPYEMGWPPQVAADGGGVLVLNNPDSVPALPRLLTALGAGTYSRTLWRITPDSAAPLGKLDALAFCGTPDDGQSICAGQDSRKLSVWLISSAGGVQRVGTYRTSQFVLPKVGPGARLLILALGEHVVVVDAVRKQATKVRFPADQLVRTADAVGDRLGVVSIGANSSSQVVVYSINPGQ